MARDEWQVCSGAPGGLNLTMDIARTHTSPGTAARLFRRTVPVVAASLLAIGLVLLLSGFSQVPAGTARSDIPTSENRVDVWQELVEGVVRRAVAVALEGFLVARLFHIEEDAGPQNPVDAIHLRAVGIVGRFALGVVLAVNGRPFLGHLTGGHPQPETEKVCRDRVQVQCTVCRMAVQVNRDTGDRDVGQAQGDQQNLPPGQVEQAMAHPVNQGVKRRRIVQKHAWVSRDAPVSGKPGILGFRAEKRQDFPFSERLMN